MRRFRGVGALTWAFLVQSWRSKPALFWNLVLPLLFLIGLSYVFGGGETERVTWIVPGILTINLLSASVFGLALHMVSLRERGMYRRLRATPATSSTVVTAHVVTAMANMMVSVALQLALARALFGVTFWGDSPALMAASALAALALLPLGLLVGGGARDMKSAPMISNLVFFPMMFLSGAAMPLFLMPDWIRTLALALPSTYVVDLLQAVALRGAGFGWPAFPTVMLVLTVLVGMPLAAAAFRWESEGPIERRRVAVAVVCLAALYGAALLRGEALESSRPPPTEPLPSEAPLPSAGVPDSGSSDRTVLFGATILDGLGGRIERGRVTIEGGRIVEVAAGGVGTEGGTDMGGAFIVPGLIDSHVHLGGSAGGAASSAEFSAARLRRDLQVYLAWGVTSFVSMTDDPDDLRSLREAVGRGTMRAPRPFFSGPGLTAPRGHPSVYFAAVPGLAGRITRQIDSPEGAVAAVRELGAGGVDLIKFYLDAGRIGESLPVLTESAAAAGMDAARAMSLATTAHVDSDLHARLAIRLGVRGIEHVPPDLSAETIAELAERGVTLTPTLAASEGLARAIRGEAVTDSDVRRWVDPRVVVSLTSPGSWVTRVGASAEAVAYYTRRHERTLEAIRRAVAGGVPILAGSDAGNPGAFHGLGLLRELELLVDAAGMTPAEALISATGAAARRLGSTDVGRIAPGAFADLVVLDGDPSVDIRALRRVRAVYFRGERLDRETILTSAPGDWMPRAGVDRR
ncbi:MAG: amidohydrolase family protein [Verrucomicrobiae bacterium]|nr:amidohydrolase family protein [Verrucomicrobiae bacterium]